MTPTSIILCGSSGAGKTTLATELRDEFKYHYYKSPIRSLEEKYGGRDLIYRDKETRNKFQQEAATAISNQLVNAMFNASRLPFVSDRGIDFLAYECLYGTQAHVTLKMELVSTLIGMMVNCHKYNTRIVLLTRNATEHNGGRWHMPSMHKYYTRGEVRRQEIALETIMKLHGIPYVQIQRFLVPTQIKNPIREMLRKPQ